MADPIWLDTCTIGNIVDGDSALESEIQGLGTTLLIVPKVQEELLNGNPFQPKMMTRTPDQIAAAKQVLTRLNISVDNSGSAADRQALFERQFKFKPNGTTVVRAIEESDAIVLSQIAASATARNVTQPTFITTDGRLARNADAKLWGVAIRMPSGPPGGAGGGGVSGAPAGTFVLNLPRVTPGVGAANAGSMMLVFQIIDALQSYFNSKYTDAAVKSEISQTLLLVRGYQRDNPAQGVLVVLSFSRQVFNDASGVMNKSALIHPGDNFEYIDTFYALSPTLAVKAAQGQREYRRDLGPTSPFKLTWGKKMFWINAATPPLETPVGKWRVVVSRWTWIYDFDPQGRVRWTDPFNQQTGAGSWRIDGDQMILVWDAPSTTVDRWVFPLDPLNAAGRCVMPGAGGGDFQLQAQKI